MRWLSDSKVSRLQRVANWPDFSATKYRCIQEIARGGMGTVYLAEDTELDRQIAIKVLNEFESHSGLADVPDLARRMRREARVIARLEHPGILPVHDVGVLEDGRVFYAMKLVRGERLDQYALQTDSIKDRLRKFQAVCEAVAFAHAHGVIHRDLKPQNIMIGSFGEVIVLDWGVAKIGRHSVGVSSEADTLMLAPKSDGHGAKAEAEADTTHGTIIGTAGYMSPEQARGETEKLDGRSDVYSLGAILYLLLTNRAPASAELPGANAEMLFNPGPRELNPKVSKAAEAVCLKAMASSIDARYASAGELSADIVKLIDDEPVTAYRENVFERFGRWLAKNRFLVFLVLAYLLMRIFFILTARR